MSASIGTVEMITIDSDAFPESEMNVEMNTEDGNFWNRRRERDGFELKQKCAGPKEHWIL